MDLDPDRTLALAYVPAAKRPALAALWRLDAALGSVLASGREPMVTRIRLAWWREALERLDTQPPPPEPLLQALAAEVLGAGVTGAELAGLEEGWEAITAVGAPSEEELVRHGAARGGRLFALSARLLGDEAFPVTAAGARWALADLARHSSDPREAEAARAMARAQGEEPRWPKRLRPLGMLAALALSDLNKTTPYSPGSPMRMLRMMFHRVTGR